MKLLFLWGYSAGYLADVERRFPEASHLPYHEHLELVLDDSRRWSAELCRHMRSVGIDADYAIATHPALQRKWAREHAFSSYADATWMPEIALEQVRTARPDVVWISSLFELFGDFVREARRYAGRVIAWVGEPWPIHAAPDGIDALITENPGTFAAVQEQFSRVIVTTPGFSRRIWSDIRDTRRIRRLAFCGKVLDVHRKRAELLALLIRCGLDIEIFTELCHDAPTGRLEVLREAAWHLARRGEVGRAIETVNEGFACTPFQRNIRRIRRQSLAPVYGMEMFRTLAASEAVLNVHADIAGNHAGNMRMFEATGAGACLVTEHSDNIRDLFEPGREVLTYRNASELKTIVSDVLPDSARIAQIAQAGQQRTLEHHTIERLYDDIVPALTG